MKLFSGILHGGLAQRVLSTTAVRASGSVLGSSRLFHVASSSTNSLQHKCGPTCGCGSASSLRKTTHKCGPACGCGVSKRMFSLVRSLQHKCGPTCGCGLLRQTTHKCGPACGCGVSKRMFSLVPSSNADSGASGGASPPHEEEEWTSLATRDLSTAQHKSIQISPRKLQELIRPLRGLSAEEAMIQMKLSSKRKAVYVEKCIRAACTAAVNNYNMDQSRLVIHHINATKGKYIKLLNVHARGKTGMRFHYYSHLKVSVREQAPVKGEKKLGKWGRRHDTVRLTQERMERFRKFKQEEQERTKDQYK